MQVDPINHIPGVIAEQHPIHAELHSIELLLRRLPGNNAFTESIAIWHAGFVHALNHPNPQVVIDAFVNELELNLRFPGNIDAPLPREIFEDTNPLVKLLINRLTDPQSPLFSKRITEEAHQQLHLPADVIKQIGRLNALRAARANEAANYVPEVRQLNARLQEAEDDHLSHEAAAMQRVNAAFQDLRADIADAAANDQALREARLAEADQLLQEARELRLEADRLQGRIQAAGVAINAVERANMQLQADINNTRAAINERKSGWLEQLACVAISVAVSWALQQPIAITPTSGGATVGCIIC